MGNINIKNQTGIIITAITLTLMVVAILVPVIHGMSTTTVVGTNEDIIGATGRYSDMDEVTLSYVVDGEQGYPAINGKRVTEYATDTNSWIVVSTNFIAVTYKMTDPWNYFINDNGTYRHLVGGTTSNNYTISVHDGLANVKNDTLGIDSNIVADYCFVPDNNGDYAHLGLSIADGYINKNSKIAIYSSQANNNGSGYGTYDDVVTGYHTTSQSLDTDYVYTIAYSYVTMGNDEIVKLTSGSTGSIIAPIEYQYEEAQQGIVYTLLGYTPIIILVGLFIAILGNVIYTRIH